MSIKAEIIADSINPQGCRLTTYILEYPRFIHAELMTHRMFSKNAASSRAIPIEKMIQQVMDNPAMPVWWGKNQSGMQAKEELDDVHPLIVHNDNSVSTNKSLVKTKWLEARDSAIEYVKSMNALGLHKQITNRLLEPWFNIRIILSGTEFENFFALRAHPDAQPEIQALAYKMLEEYNKSEPKKLRRGDWHIPFGDKIDDDRLYDVLNKTNCGAASSLSASCGFHLMKSVTKEHACGAWDIVNEAKRKISIARCARISYFNFAGKDDYEVDIELCDRLFGSVPRHLSPTEHVAQCQDNATFVGNFRGWKQYRYLFDDQNLKDSRVKNVKPAS